MNLTKLIPARKETIEFSWVKKDWMNYGRFRIVRKTMEEKGASKHLKCWCGHKFQEHEQLAIAGAYGIKNTILCEACAELIEPSPTAISDQKESE